MTAAGDAVLAVALGEVGYVEGPNNSTKYWDWYGGNYGPWCGVFCMWCSDQAGHPVCTDTVLVSNGTVHGYSTGGSGATGVEAQRTLDLQSGDFVLFSWEPWEFRDGVPTCVGEWDGYPAGDHIGIVHTPPDGSGYFSAVEGNTSDGSWDNGGMVMLRHDRHTSQVCGWWRQESIATGGSTSPLPEELFTVGQYEDIMSKLGELVTRTDWILKACHKCRLIDAHGAWWLTDFIGVTPATSPDMVVMLQQLGYLDNDVDAAGNPIAQGCPDALFDGLVRYDLVATDQAANG